MFKLQNSVRWVLLLVMGLALLGPTAVFAQEGDGHGSDEDTHSTETTDEHGEAVTTDEHGEAVTTSHGEEGEAEMGDNSNFAVGITLFLIGFILLIVISVVIISTAGLGIIGIGVALSSAGDD